MIGWAKNPKVTHENRRVAIKNAPCIFIRFINYAIGAYTKTGQSGKYLISRRANPPLYITQCNRGRNILL